MRHLLTLALAAAAAALTLTGCTAPATTTTAGAPTVTAAPTPAVVSRPTRIRIPALGVEANIIDLGLQPDGTMEVPPDAADAGWYTGSKTPGQVGPAVIAAHVNWKGVDGPFARLADLKPGDRVNVEHDNGVVTEFAVDRVEEHPKTAFPTDDVYSDTAGPELRLVTCGGRFDSGTGHYTANTIAFARLAA